MLTLRVGMGNHAKMDAWEPTHSTTHIQIILLELEYVEELRIISVKREVVKYNINRHPTL